ncbi:sugar ABC transporter substrate-binding protein [Caldibacillus lycopersici]|uniref:Sugar ABC transporter substrate-binding protein n=1 Tax=Perspicuibacillus lycopersici TaxID=1325689 RepID=A0AAE3LQA9_9BACI|nr:sugar ABC transporter substrate-binding protein [Perspicuibacillus lycopersici]MCU9613284.1 sugar ABC transporter substrate-binding protein [Perspicuibacillus lycopersici]
MKKKKTSTLLLFFIVLVSGLLFACSNGNDNGDGSVELRFIAANHPWTEAIEPLLPEFEKETGIKVKFEKYFEDQLTQKLTTEFTAGSTSIDLFMMRPLQEGKLFNLNGWVADISSYTDDADWEYGDFTDPSVNSLKADDVLFGIPIVTEREILYYRKDIFEENNIEVPKTVEELMNVAKLLNDPANDFYGFVARGQSAAAVTQFSSFLYGFGGDFFVDGKATLDTPEAIEAFQFYGDMLREYGPPGVLNMSWPQAAGLFGQGKAAMYTDADSIYPNLTDPEKSVVGDKVGFTLFPAGPNGQTPYNVTSWGLAVNSKSENKDEAMEFIKWATSKEVVAKLQDNGVPGPRQSVWDNQQGTDTFPSELVDVINQANAIGREYDRPLVIKVNDARDIIGTVIVAAIQGEDVEAAAKAANKQFQELLDDEK